MRHRNLAALTVLLGLLLAFWWERPEVEADGPLPARLGAGPSEERGSSGVELGVIAGPLAREAQGPPVADEPPLATPAGGLEDWLLELARIEKAIVANAGQDPARHTALEVELEAVVGAVMLDPENLQTLLGMLVGRPDGVLELSEELRYGTVRALFWWVVIQAGQGIERDALTAILSALPEVHPDAIDQLILNLTEARVDGRLVLDGSYLEVILQLRAAFPERQGLYTRLFEVIGDTLTPEERMAFFSLFLSDTTDPLLVGLTVANLLGGSDPEFGLLVAGEVLDDPQLAYSVRMAAARSVAKEADLYAATDFLVERSNLLANEPVLWLELGFRDDSTVALMTRYEDLRASGADPTARRLLVSAMREATAAELVAIAAAESDHEVMGQALLTGSGRTGADGDTYLDLIAERRHLGELGGGMKPVHVLMTLGNIAGRAERDGAVATRDRAVDMLKDFVGDPSVSESCRRQGAERLRKFAPEPVVAELLIDLGS